MYETLHTEQLESPSYHGFTFVAQLSGGEVRFGAKLTLHIGPRNSDFLIWQYEWDRTDGPYTFPLNKMYKDVFETDAVQTWVNKSVPVWVKQQKRQYLKKQIRHERERITELTRELEQLDTD